NEALDVPVKQNVINNNKVITRNLMVVDLTNGKRVSKWLFNFANGSSATQSATLEVVTDRHMHPSFSGDLSAYMYATLHLDDLYDLWKNAGRHGNAVIYDDIEKTVTFDPSVPLRLDSIPLTGYASYPVLIEFAVRENTPIDYPITGDRIHVRHLVQQTEVFREVETVVEKLEGNLSFAINIEEDSV